jgi:hypothetical protein
VLQELDDVGLIAKSARLQLESDESREVDDVPFARTATDVIWMG